MSLDVEALRSSFKRVAPQADLLADRFYERLFENYPHLRKLFAETEFTYQRRKLIQALTVIVKSLEDPDALSRFLHDLGRRHDQYGITEDDYSSVAETLLAVLAELTGEAWSDKLEAEWCDALSVVAELMLDGAASGKREQKRELVEVQATAASRRCWRIIVNIYGTHRFEHKGRGDFRRTGGIGDVG